MRAPSALLTAAIAVASLAGCDPDEGVAALSSDVASRPEHTWDPAPKREGNLRVVTFNVRNFPEVPPPEPADGETSEPAPTAPTRAVTHLEATDDGLLLDVLAELDFDVLALQEIRDPAAFDAALARLAERDGRSYVSAFTANEASGNDQQVGVVVRADRLALADVTEHPEVDVRGTLRAGLSARIRSLTEGGVDLGEVVLHLASGESTKRAALRAEQAAVVADVVAARAAAWGDADVLVLGDLNTAREEQELPALDAAFAEGSGLVRQENPDGCTSYYVKNKVGLVAPSWIDHVYAASLDEIDREVPLVSGAHCAERRCQAFESDGPESGTTYWLSLIHI